MHENIQTNWLNWLKKNLIFTLVETTKQMSNITEKSWVYVSDAICAFSHSGQIPVTQAVPN